MQPHNDQYLSNFQQPQAQHNIVTKDPDSPGFGKGLAVGFTILVLIWTAEVFGEWNSIQNAKEDYYEPEQNDGPVTYEYAVCNPDDSAYDSGKCQDRIFDEAIESRETDMYIEMIKIGAWITIWVSLARLMIFGNISYRVMMSKGK
tara:strand:+ start:109 stop:546 length:438 start_codon:yes stop_codon:yes gene_type:complete